MASREAALISYLLSVLTANPIPESITPPPMPPGFAQGEATYITAHEISGDDLQSMDGPSNYTDSIMQINCFSNDRESAQAMRDRVKAALVNLSATLDSTHKVQGSEQILDTGLYDPERQIHQMITRIHMVWAT